MSVLALLVFIALAGMIGGVVNALISDNGFVLPRKEDVSGRLIVRPGVLGNVIVGGVAASISWGLYGPLAAVDLIGTTSPAGPALTLSALVGAMLVGVGGARWLTNEVDKTLLHEAATEAVRATRHPEAARRIRWMSPARVLSATRDTFD
jgi:hypothetical protein